MREVMVSAMPGLISFRTLRERGGVRLVHREDDRLADIAVRVPLGLTQKCVAHDTVAVRGEDLALEVLDLEVLLLFVDDHRPSRFLQRLGRDVRTAVDDLGKTEERTLRVFYGVNDVVAEGRLARLASEVVIRVAQLAGLERLRIFGREIFKVDVLQVRLGRGGEADARRLEELHRLTRVAVDGAVGLIVDDEIEVERRELLAVAAIGHQRLDGGDDDRGAEQLAGAAGGLVNDRFVLPEDDIEVLHRLLGELDAVHDEEHALGISGDQEAANQRSAQQRLSGAGRHFEQESTVSRLVVALRDLVHGPDLVAAQGEIRAQVVQVLRPNRCRL